MITHYYEGSATAEWLRLCAEDEHAAIFADAEIEARCAAPAPAPGSTWELPGDTSLSWLLRRQAT